MTTQRTTCVTAAVALAEPLLVATGVALSPITPLHEDGTYAGVFALDVICPAIGLTLPPQSAA